MWAIWAPTLLTLSTTSRWASLPCKALSFTYFLWLSSACCATGGRQSLARVGPLSKPLHSLCAVLSTELFSCSVALPVGRCSCSSPLLLPQQSGSQAGDGKLGGAQQVEGVQPLRKGINPATWMLEVSTLNKEHELGVDFADIYRRSDLYKCAPFLFGGLLSPWGMPLSM